MIKEDKNMVFCVNCGKELIDDFEFCPECGTKVSVVADKRATAKMNFENYHGETKVCKNCGSEMPEDAFYCLSCGNAFKEQDVEFETIKRKINLQTGTWKNKWISLLLCVLFGWLGVHRFYEGKAFTGVLYLLTLGFFGIGWLIDIVRIAMKPNPYRAK